MYILLIPSFTDHMNVVRRIYGPKYSSEEFCLINSFLIIVILNMKFLNIIINLAITQSLLTYPQYEHGSVFQQHIYYARFFSFQLSQSIPISYTHTYQQIPKVIISIKHLDNTPNIPFSFTIIQLADLTGFTIHLTSTTVNSNYAIGVFYLVTSDQYVEVQQKCVANLQLFQTFQYEHFDNPSYVNPYQSAPQVTVYLTGFKVTNTTPTLIGFRIEAQGITSTQYQIYSISRPNNQVTEYCYNAIIMPQNLGLSIQLYYDFYTSPLITSSQPSHTSTSLIYKQKFIQNTNVIDYGCTGVSYKGTTDLRSTIAYVVQSSNSITNQFDTWDGSSLYEYSIGIMLYQPKQCGVNGVDAQCLPVCGDGIVHQTEDCDDQNNNPFDGCNNCQYSCVFNCQSCSKGICQQCNSGYYLDIAQNCIPICGDGIIQDLEQCEGLQQTIFNGCINCQFQCQIECLLCELGKCKQCLNGYKINPFNICEPICGDGLIVGNEQCDDGNLIPQDGCWNCLYDCPINCQSCVQGFCIQCNTGYYDNFNKCNSLCGDGIVADMEECDDGNIYPFDECHQCQKLCSQYCLDCSHGFCLSCENGYYLKYNKCISLCGDKIITDPEQCDDGNIDIYDGCYNCTIGCPYATFIQNKRCTNVCGDGLVTIDLEQCDDGNQISRDGCSNCLVDTNYVCTNTFNSKSICYVCPLNCNSCYQGLCSSCINGYFLNSGICIQCDEQCTTCKDYPSNCIQFKFKNSQACDAKYGLYSNYNTQQCYSICGDSIQAEFEQCDDGNTLSGDGCNKLCLIEPNWTCDYSSPSQCKIQNAVNLILQTIQFHNNTYQITVSLSQQCIVNKDELIGLNIQFSSMNLFYSNISLFSKHVQNQQNISYLITVAPLQYLENLSLNISTQNSAFKSEDGKILSSMNLQVDLFNLWYISAEQLNALTNAIDFNNYLIYIMIGIGILSLLVGSFEPVLNMLDLMQYISYLQWIDIYFPYLLEQYLNIFNIVSLDLILNELGIVPPDYYPYYSTGYKLYYYSINAHLIANLQSFLFTVLQTYAFYFFIVICIAKIINIQTSYNLCVLKFQALANSLYKSSFKMHFSGFVQMIMTSYYDLTISICLFIFYPNIKNDFYFIYILLAGIIIFVLINTLYQSTIIIKRKMLCSLRSGIQTKNIYQMQYSQWSLVKKTIFCLIIVGFQESGIIQAILISLNSISFVSYLLINKPIKEAQEKFKILPIEIMICVQSLSFIGYELIINKDIILYLQWTNIGIFSLSLCLCLLIDLTKTAQRTYKKIKVIRTQRQSINSDLNVDFVI